MVPTFQLVATYRGHPIGSPTGVTVQRYNCETLATLIAKRDALVQHRKILKLETLAVLEVWSKPNERANSY